MKKNLKVLILSTYDLAGGAAKAAFRLHQALNFQNVDSYMLVDRKSSNDVRVIAPRGALGHFFARLRRKINSLSMFFLKSIYPFDLAFKGKNILNEIKKINPDVINIHWVGQGFISIKDLASIKKPIFWTLHDAWPFTGGCHLTMGCEKYLEKCGKCPQLNSVKDNDCTRKLWTKKNKAWGALNFHIVSPSKWLSKCASKSSLFGSMDISVIPNGIDLSIFVPSSKVDAKRHLGISPEKTVLFFNASKVTRDINKGMHYLEQFLNSVRIGKMSNNFLLLAVGSCDLPIKTASNVELRLIDNVMDEQEMALYYSAADLTILTSQSENLPNVIMESFACATPVLAFYVGGIPDLVSHKKSGFLAKPYDVDLLLDGLDFCLQPKVLQQLSVTALKVARDRFDSHLMAQRYLELFYKYSSFQ